jgi:hypothetical protein
LAAATPPSPAVAGYVEAVTATAVLGWAWMPGQPGPLRMQLRLGAETVAEADADELREDLARNGIGEGRHAFTLPVPEPYRPRLAELRVFACTPDGKAVPLGTPPVDGGLEDRLQALQRGMEMLVGSQRVLHRNLQAALLARSDPPGAASPAIDAQRSLQEDFATLEQFVVRLEAALVNGAPRPAAPASPRWALGGIAATAALSLALSSWALLHAMPG